jgi:hypothetical protein
MTRSGTNFVWQSPMLSPHRDVRRRESSCKSSHSVVSVAHELPSYPLAYSLTVIPLSISRWVQFRVGPTHVTSAAVLFGNIMFNLDGAANVLLFLIVRPHLLLFTPPEKLVDPIAELANPTSSSVLLPDVHNHSPQPMGAEPTNDV